MAQIPTVLPDVRPDTRAPDDYQHVQANPNEFGAQIGQGAERLGQGITKATDFYGEIAADQSNFNATDEGTKLLYGDPNKKVPGPDGTMIPDTGFFGKKNQDMMEARDATAQQLQDIIKKHREDLGLNSSQLQYDRDTRRWLQLQMSRMGEAYDKASTGWALDVNNMGKKQTSDAISNDAESDAAFGAHLDKLKSWYVKDAHVQGLGNEGAKQGLIDATKSAWETRINTIGVYDPLRAAQMANEHRNELGDAWTLLANRYKLAADKADVATSTKKAWNQTFATPQATATGNYGPTFTRYNQFLNNGDIKSALRLSEATRLEPYWDQAKTASGQPAGTGHWAIGVGSHTVTRADGSTEEVTRNTRITKEDAERDLDRRTNEAVQTASNAVGEAWRGMTQGQHAALTSIVYNYGHLPTDIASAARSGNIQALANAITAHAGDNAGVNRERRRAEAGAVLGGQQGGQQPVRTEEGEQPVPANYISTPVSPPTPTTDFIPSPYPPTVPDGPEPETPEQIIDRLTVTKEKALAQVLLDHPGWTDQQQMQAKVELDGQMTLALAAANESAHDQRVHKDAVYSQVYKMLREGKSAAELMALPDTAPGLSEKERWDMKQFISKEIGQPSPIEVGPKFTDIERRIALPPGDPDRLGLGDGGKLLDLVLSGAITRKGMEEAIKDINIVAKSPDEAADVQKKHTQLTLTRSEMLHEDELAGTKPGDVDPKLQIAREKGYQRYETAYLDEYSKYREGKVKEFKYFDPNEAEKLKEISYPLRQRLHDELVAGGGETTYGKAPVGVNPNSWSVVMSNPPIHNNQFIPAKNWSLAVNDLLNDPSPQNMNDFNKLFKGSDGTNDAATIVQALAKPFELTVGGVPQAELAGIDIGEKVSNSPGGRLISGLLSKMEKREPTEGGATLGPLTINTPHWLESIIGRKPTEEETKSVETVQKLLEEQHRPGI